MDYTKEVTEVSKKIRKSGYSINRKKETEIPHRKRKQRHRLRKERYQFVQYETTAQQIKIYGDLDPWSLR